MEEDIIRERIKENEGLFSREELITIKENAKVIRKIYQLGLLDSIQIDRKNL